MRVTKYLLVVTVALFASCSATSAATDSEQAMTSTMASPNMVKLIDDALLENAGTRFLRSSKTEEEEEERNAGAVAKLAQNFGGAVVKTTPKVPKVPKMLQDAMNKNPIATNAINNLLAKGKSKKSIISLLTKVNEDGKREITRLVNGIWLQKHPGGI